MSFSQTILFSDHSRYGYTMES